MTRLIALALLFSTGCTFGDMTQIVGDGTVYSATCSAEMEVRGSEFFARCTPPTCIDSYTSAPVNHTVVAIEPDKRIIGMAERPCIQTASDLSELTNRSTTVTN
jgi:hypothetical protein